MITWELPPDGWPGAVPWPPPLWPHRYDAALIARWVRDQADAAERRRALLMTAPDHGCCPP